MTNPLRAYQEQHGRTDEEMATDLSALLGRKIGAPGYRLHSNRAKAPKAWADALGLEQLADSSGTDPWDEPPAAGEETLERESGAPPKAPAGASFTSPSAGGDFGFAKTRLVQAYAALGAGATMMTSNGGYAAVSDNYAPHLADAWIAAAKTNENVAKIVRFMESGGPVGELVVGHIILVLGFVYVSGRGPDLEAIYGKFSGYRIAAAGGRIADEAAAVAHAAQNNGAAPQGAESSVGDPRS